MFGLILEIKSGIKFGGRFGDQFMTTLIINNTDLKPTNWKVQHIPEHLLWNKGRIENPVWNFLWRRIWGPFQIRIQTKDQIRNHVYDNINNNK